MAITVRHYTSEPGITEDYFEVRKFFLTRDGTDFPFGRWDWMITHGWLDVGSLPRIGLWEECGRIVAVATFDTQPGEAFICALPEYGHLKSAMLRYSIENITVNGKLDVIIADADSELQEAAAQAGLEPTPRWEYDAVFPIRDPGGIVYRLPEGFQMTDMKENFDIYRYGQVLWKGFNHEADGEGIFKFTDGKRAALTAEMLRPNVDLGLKIAAVAPNGDFASYCGMWFDPASENALVEPVATDPAYRKLGLGKAVVLEGVRRCGLLGAKRAYVGSCQQFYYSIGFRPCKTYTRWRKKTD